MNAIDFKQYLLQQQCNKHGEINLEKKKKKNTSEQKKILLNKRLQWTAKYYCKKIGI